MAGTCTVRYAVQEEVGVTEIWHFARGVRVFSEQTRADAFAFAPDGRLFFTRRCRRVWRFGTLKRAGRSGASLDSRVPNTLLIDQENSSLVVNDLHERAIRLIDVETGRERERWTDSVGRNAMSLSSDGRLLAAGDWNGSVFVWDMKRHALLSTLTGHTNYVGHCQFARGLTFWRRVAGMVRSGSGTRRWADALFEIKMANFLAFAPDGNGVALLVGDRKLTMGTIVHSETYQALNPEMIGNGSKEQVEGGSGSLRTIQPGRPVAGDRSERWCSSLSSEAGQSARPSPIRPLRIGSVRPRGKGRHLGRTLGLLPLANPALGIGLANEGRAP